MSKDQAERAKRLASPALWFTHGLKFLPKLLFLESFVCRGLRGGAEAGAAGAGDGGGGAGETGRSFRGTSSTCWRRISPGGRSSWRSGRGAPPQGTGCQTPLPMPRAKPRGDYGAEGIQRSLVGYRCVHSGPDSRLPSISPGRLSEGVLLKKAALFCAVANPGFLPAFCVSSSWPGLCGSKPIAIPLLRLSWDRPVRGSGGRDLSLCPCKPEPPSSGHLQHQVCSKRGDPIQRGWTRGRRLGPSLGRGVP